jgi:outer membrane protein assembly factor BamD (BamD/ComL family)
MAPPPVVSAPPPVVSAPASLAGVAAPASPVAAPRPAVVPLRAASRRATLAAREEGGTDDGASGVFGAAESARGRGDLAEARRLYAELASRFRGTREELSARVLGGQMLLDDLDEPAAALGAFDRYLRDEPAGTLAEEAVVGRAQALRRLGRADAEAAAWNDLLVRYPRSVHAELARERLAALVPAP